MVRAQCRVLVHQSLCTFTIQILNNYFKFKYYHGAMI